jgi:hypothetical protein
MWLPRSWRDASFISPTQRASSGDIDGGKLQSGPIMMTDPRYAIYFVPAPDTALYRFGAAALGYDCFRLLQHFVAIVPMAVGAGLDRLAASCVKHFDGFRAPLTSVDRSRRLTAHLTARQIGHVERWGYPYVFEDFRFHMTLTGALSADRQEPMLAYLQGGLACSHGDVPIRINRLALLRQDNPGARFVVLAHGAIS